MTAGRYMAVWLFATNDASEPIMAVLGQREDTTLSNAQDNNTLDGLSLSTLFLQEMNIIARLIFQTSTGYANTPHARLRDILDLRDVTSAPTGGFTATSHNSLSGRDTLPAHPSSALTADASGFDKTLTSADDTVQKALDTLDDKTPPFKLSYDFSVFSLLGYVETGNVVYTAIVPFPFAGTNASPGWAPNAADVLVSSDGVETVDARLYDVTNAQTIAEATGIAVTASPLVASLGSVANLPTGLAHFEFQVRKNSGKVRLYGATLYYK